MNNILDKAAHVALGGEFKVARSTAIVVMGEDKFMEKVNGLRPILAELCEKNNISKMEATLDILRSLQGKEVETMLAMAACAEIIEPTIGL